MSSDFVPDLGKAPRAPRSPLSICPENPNDKDVVRDILDSLVSVVTNGVPDLFSGRSSSSDRDDTDNELSRSGSTPPINDIPVLCSVVSVNPLNHPVVPSTEFSSKLESETKKRPHMRIAEDEPNLADKKSKLDENEIALPSLASDCSSSSNQINPGLSSCSSHFHRAQTGSSVSRSSCPRSLPTLRIVAHDDPSANGRDVIAVPADPKEFYEFIDKLTELAVSGHYGHIVLDTIQLNAIYRNILLKKIGCIRAHTLICIDTWMTKATFCKLVLEKERVIIKEEYTTMYSTAYSDVVRIMYSRKSNLKYFETPLRRSAYVAGYLMEDIKTDVILGILCKDHPSGGICINEKDFKLTITYFSLTVEVIC